MVFWITAIALAFAVTVILSVTLLRSKSSGEHPAAYDMRVYRDQLKEVDRDLARGVLAKDDAERIRAEVGRRVLAADAQLRAAETDGTQPRYATRLLALAVGLVLVGGTAGLYWAVGKPGARDLPQKARIDASDELRRTRLSQSDAEARVPADASPAPDPKFAALMEQLRQSVIENPDELEGLQLLARNEAGLGNYAASYAAQANVIRVKGEGATAADYSVFAEMMIRAANGYVSPEAEEALKQALNRDPRFPPARYFTALMMAQNDRPDVAFRLMDKLLSESTPDAPWVPPIRGQIEELAWRAGVRYTLPEASAGAPVMGGAAAPGPSAEDMANAADMSPEERQKMVRGMVTRLSERLATEGGSPEEWSRLISAYGVLGETDRAAAIWAEAQQVFGDKPPLLDVVRQGALRAGVADTPPATALSGPTQNDIANAAEMSGADRAEMIAGMVSRLAERLQSEGGSPQEWARLITSQATLGNAEAASQSLENARSALSGNDAALAVIEAAAAQAGLSE